MLSKTLDQTMAKAMKYENMTRKTIFGRNYYAELEKQNNDCDMLNKLAPYIKSAQSVGNPSAEDEVINFIVEDPNVVAPVFEFNRSESSGVPFFVSLAQKLNIAQIAEE